MTLMRERMVACHSLASGLHGVLQDAVNAVFDDYFGVAGFDVNVTGAAFESGEDYGVHQANDGADAGIARELLHRNIFFAVLFVADYLKRETFGGLVEDALGLLGALEEVANLRCGGDFDLQALARGAAKARRSDAAGWDRRRRRPKWCRELRAERTCSETLVRRGCCGTVRDRCAVRADP